MPRDSNYKGIGNLFLQELLLKIKKNPSFSYNKIFLIDSLKGRENFYKRHGFLYNYDKNKKIIKKDFNKQMLVIL